MVVDTSRWILPVPALAEVEVTAEQLGRMNGFRSVWLAADGHLWHTEPDVELEDEGFTLVGTFLAPPVESLLDALARRRQESRAHEMATAV